MKLSRFLVQLGSQNGAPGGGAAAALTGASGAALVEMTARLNDKRLKSSSGNASRAAKLREKLHRLISQDASAFKTISKAYPARKTKPAAWQKALKAGAQPPLAVCETCAAAAKLAKNEKNRTSAWLESDRRESLILLRAAFESAVLNADINLKELRDRSFAALAQGKIKKWRRSL